MRAFLVSSALAVAAPVAPASAASPDPVPNVAVSAGAWETPKNQIPSPRACKSLEDPRLKAVLTTKRQEAILRLSVETVVPLTEREAAALIGNDSAAGQTPGAIRLVQKRIDLLRARRRRQMILHIGGWSRADEEELANYQNSLLGGEYHGLRPFLVRAVAKWENTGGLSGSLCGGELIIVHQSLGRSTPSTILFPAVVYLHDMPSRVYTTWSIAE